MSGWSARPEVVVGAEVEDGATVGEVDVRRLGRGDHPFTLEQSVIDERATPSGQVIEQCTASVPATRRPPSSGVPERAVGHQRRGRDGSSINAVTTNTATSYESRWGRPAAPVRGQGRA